MKIALLLCLSMIRHVCRDMPVNLLQQCDLHNTLSDVPCLNVHILGNAFRNFFLSLLNYWTKFDIQQSKIIFCTIKNKFPKNISWILSKLIKNWPCSKGIFSFYTNIYRVDVTFGSIHWEQDRGLRVIPLPRIHPVCTSDETLQGLNMSRCSGAL